MDSVSGQVDKMGFQFLIGTLVTLLDSFGYDPRIVVSIPHRYASNACPLLTNAKSAAAFQFLIGTLVTDAMVCYVSGILRFNSS